jgi:hypothetical protein
MPIVVALALCAAPHVVAQSALHFRYAPQVGSSLHRLVWTEGTIAFGEGMVGQPLADSVVLELNELHSVTQTVRAREATNFVVQVQLDSGRTRMRPQGGPWKLVAADTTGPKAGTFVFDERLRIREIRGGRGDSITDDRARELRNAMPGFEAALPEAPVSVGASWTSDIVFPLGELVRLDQEDLPTSVAPSTEFVVRAAFQLDSLMVRGPDTLAFVGVSGNFMPMTVSVAAESGQGNVQVSGAFSGRLIWSTAWSAYVSGAVRTGVHMAQEEELDMMGQPAVPDATAVLVRLAVTQRFQVRQ